MFSIQFELWKNCTNNCTFCFNKKQKNSTNEDKIRILKNVIYVLQTKNLSLYKRIGIIGGELFDPNQLNEIKSQYEQFLLDISNILVKNKHIMFYVTSNLLYDNLYYLEFIIKILINLKIEDHLFLCTSYDTIGRFHTKEKEKLFYNNMKYIKSKYPSINIHVEILPTQAYIESVLENSFNPRSFEKEYSCKIDYSDLNSGFFWKDKYHMQKEVPNFFPTRKSFIKFLYKCYKEDLARPEDICNYSVFFNELYRLDEDNQLQLILRHGHDSQLPYGIIEKSDYIDSNKLMIEDVNNVWRQIHESR